VADLKQVLPNLLLRQGKCPAKAGDQVQDARLGGS
jgi:hypothetical protein